VKLAAGIYARGSKEEINLENQLGPLRQLCAAREWEPVEYLEQETGDDDRARRPVFEQLLQDARKGRVRVIVVVGLDRLTRRVARLLQLFADCDRWNVRIVSLREKESWTDMDRRIRDFVLHGLGLAAELELENLRERTRKGLARARPATPGGIWRTKSGKAIGRPKANQLLLGAAARHRQAGMSLREAAKAAGVKPSSLRRYMARLEAAEAPGNDEGGPASTGGAP
jgi:DNA invertase Pin-like site-specific DNA recombinase